MNLYGITAAYTVVLSTLWGSVPIRVAVSISNPYYHKDVSNLELETRDDPMSSTKAIMRYHGAKWRLAPWIIKQFPNHYCYAEPFGGSAAVLLSKEPAAREVYNDKNDELVTLFNVIRDDDMRRELLRLMVMTPYSRTEFDFAKEYTRAYRDGRGKIEGGLSSVMTAHQLLVRAQMGFGSSGATRSNTGFRIDTAKGGTSVQSLWSELPESIIAVTERLRNVIIENTDAYNVIKQHDRDDTLFYVDPPYLTDTRVNTDSYGAYEMILHEHERLLKLINKSAGKFVVSGYDSEVYNDMLAGWSCKYSETTASSGGRSGSSKRVECLWISPSCESAQLDMFG